jgi:glycosyltransferase involved in cell wall biosynthesis
MSLAVFSEFRPLLVLAARTRWSEPPRMRHYMARYLSAYCNVLFCELDQSGPPTRIPVDGRIAVFRPGMRLPGVGRFRPTRACLRRYEASAISRFARELPASMRMMLNFKFDFIEIYRNRSIFDGKFTFLNDDFVNMVPSDSQATRSRKRAAQARVVEGSDRVFVSSELLATDVQGMGPPVTVIHSGHEFRPEWNEPPSFGGSSVNVCFMGFIHDKLQVEWIASLAAKPGVSVSMIGPVESAAVRSALGCYSNVAFQSALEGQALQLAMSRCDVFIMPYRDEPVNAKATVPAKLFPYLACGRPIVAGGVGNLIGLPPGFVYSASDADEFVQLVHQARSEDSVELVRQRVEFAMKHTWGIRAEGVWRLMTEDITRLRSGEAGRGPQAAGSVT